MNKRQLGSEYESIASKYLEELGYTILERNYHCKYGEIDIIAVHGNYICFIEVKYRKNTKFGYPVESITPHKRVTISNVAKIYLSSKGYKPETMIRFDTVLILDSKLSLIKNAFGGI